MVHTTDQSSPDRISSGGNRVDHLLPFSDCIAPRQRNRRLMFVQAKEARRALEINPNFPVAYAQKGIALILSGRARESFSATQLALRLSPKDPSAVAWRFNLCHAHLHLREYKEAIEECTRTINMNNVFWLAYIDLISAYGTTGQLEQARQRLAELNKIRPDSTMKWHREFVYGMSSNPLFRREIDDLLDGLRKGGLREQ